jgi:hypothetical protein
VIRHPLRDPERFGAHEVDAEPREHLRPVGGGGREADRRDGRVHRQRDRQDQEGVDDDGPDELVQPGRGQEAALHGEPRERGLVRVLP